ncbi:MAG: PEP-utilizing enzyme [bacterium]
MKWRINFSIPNCNYNIVNHPASLFIKKIPKKDDKFVLEKMYFAFENGVLTGYAPVDALKNTVECIKEKIIKDPGWAEEIHSQARDINQEFFAHARTLVNMDFGRLDNQELWQTYKKLRTMQSESHYYSIPTTWFLDSEGEVFTNYLKERLRMILRDHGLDDETKLVDYFILLTTPSRPGFTQEEELGFLQLLKKIKSDPEAVKFFIQEKNLQAIYNQFPLELKRDIEEHYQKWHWVPYGYIGPAYELDYYLEKIRQSINNIEAVDEIMAEELSRYEKVRQQQQNLVKEIKIFEEFGRLFAIARDIIWLKDYRKYCFWHGHYVLDKINSEIARRLCLTLEQVNHIADYDMENAVLKGQVDQDKLNQSIKCSIFCATENGDEHYWGEQARQIIDRLDIDEPGLDLSGDFKGSCAYPGKLRGKVKIVLSVDDIYKVEQGDIMVALTTYPAMLPAMKRARAIISQDGGITCHAAIVAREFRITCVVGVSKVTERLSDGDDVEIDAVRGIVKKL